MEYKSLKQRVDAARLALTRAQCDLLELQNECTHPKETVEKKYGSNTGNYDPHQDCYWTDFKCGICDKMWTENGSL